MQKTVLVAYATRYGSTQEVAEAIATTLGEASVQVDLRSAKDVKSLDTYDLVILGAPIFIGKWHKDAHRFLAQHKDALMERPPAIFALGPLKQEEMQGSVEQFDEELASYPWLAPIAVKMFVGSYDEDKLTFPHTLINTLPASPLKEIGQVDNRDWDAIRGWAKSLMGVLHQG